MHHGVISASVASAQEAKLRGSTLYTKSQINDFLDSKLTKLNDDIENPDETMAEELRSRMMHCPSELGQPPEPIIHQR